MWTDTHTHLFLPEFDNDRKDVVSRAVEAGVSRLFVPNVDDKTIDALLNFTNEYNNIAFPMVGFHPGSVREDWQKRISFVNELLEQRKFVAIGEIGIDLYWDENKKFEKEQKEAFAYQIHLANKNNLPIVIHTRSSMQVALDVVNAVKPNKYGIFHCFSGSYEEAKKVIDKGFFLGIGGVVTFKNSNLPEIVKKVGVEHIVLETDSPFLTPVPHRGKRNESAYIPIIGKKVAEITQTPIGEVASITTRNSKSIFGV